MPAGAHIHSLRLSGGEDHRLAVLRGLEQAEWDVGPDDGVLILRKIQVGAPLPDIGRRVLEQARGLGARAVDGWEAWAERADAVRFASRSDLLACLSRDLLRGQPRWFWRSWRELFDLPPGAAVARAMDADAAYWPAVVHGLQVRGETEALWHALRPMDAQQLLATLEQATGWTLTWPNSALSSRSMSVSDTPGTVPETTRTWLRNLPEWLWSAASIQAARSRSDLTPLRLAIITWLWQSAPRTLSASDTAYRIGQIAEALLASLAGHGNEASVGVSAHIKLEDVAPSPRIQGDSDSVSMPGSHFQLRTDEVTEDNAGATRPGMEAMRAEAGLDSGSRIAETATSPSQPPPPAGEGRRAAQVAAPHTGEALAPSPRAGRAGVGSDSPPQVNRGSSATSDSATDPSPQTLTPNAATAPAETRFVTGQGGWFYLLNALALPAVQARLQSRDHDVYSDARLADGWIWLYRLGRALGGVADPALADFLARSAGLAGPAALDALPPRRDENELARLARARFGDAVCNAALFPVPALIVATSSHVDAHYRMTDIRLDMRRAALDIDPGWLPWLGRVVRFHYGRPAELLGWETP